MTAFYGDEILDPLIGNLADEIDRRAVDEHRWMGFEEAMELPIVEARDVMADMSELLVMKLLVPMEMLPPVLLLTGLPVFHALALWPSDFGWYRVEGLDHHLARFFAEANSFEEVTPPAKSRMN